MAIDYVSAGASLLSAGSSLFGGGGKSAERAAKDAAARAGYAQESSAASARAQLNPFVSAGTNAENELAYLLGTGGYSTAKPTWDDAYNTIRSQHFQQFGKDYNRNSNVADERKRATDLHNKNLATWQTGFDQWKTQQGVNSEFGSLLNPFSQSDLDNDLVYQNGLQFGLDQGQKSLDAMLRANGSLGSGRAVKDATRFGNDYATSKTNDANARFQANKDFTYNALTGQAQRGLSAVGTGVGVAQNSANNIGNANMSSANSIAALSQNRDANRQNSLDGLLNNLLYTYKNQDSRQYKQPAGTTPPFIPNYPNYYQQD